MRVDGYRIELRSLEIVRIVIIVRDREKDKTVVLVLRLVISLNY